MRDGGDVANTGNHEAHSLKGADGGFTTCPGALDEYVDMTHPGIDAAASGLFGGALGSESSALARTLEADNTCTGRGDHVSLRIRDANQRIVER